MSPSRYRDLMYARKSQLQQRVEVWRGLIGIIILFVIAAVIPALVINFILLWNHAQR